MNSENDLKFLELVNRGKPPCDYERQLLLKHFLRVKTILSGKIIPPFEVEIQPSSSCNLACSHCFGRNYMHLPNSIGKEEIKHIAKEIDNFKENGFEIETAKFCGTTGEPLTNPYTADGIYLFKEQRKKVILFTNGLLLGKYIEPILSADKINLSLDCASSSTFQCLKKVDGFEKVMSGLEKLVNEKKRKGSKLNITVSYVIGRKNYHEILEFANKMKKIGVDDVLFRVDFTDTEGIKSLAETIEKSLNDAETLSNSECKIVSVYDNKSIEGNCSAFNTYNRKCFNHNFWACIGSDCNLYVCGHRTYKGVTSYGSILEHSFRELWVSAQRLESICLLPDEHCRFCSPSSVRRNDLMYFLAQLPLHEVERLENDYILD